MTSEYLLVLQDIAHVLHSIDITLAFIGIIIIFKKMH